MGRKSRILTKEEIINAFKVTKSAKGAARYLNCSYWLIKKWAKFYKDLETGKSIYDIYKNPSGKGIPKFIRATGKLPDWNQIVQGEVDITMFDPQKIKYRLMRDGILKTECYTCGFSEKRLLDEKSPLLLNFRDKNKRNYRLENIEILCYNCYFIQIGDIFTKKEAKKIEHFQDNLQGKAPDWELDEYQKERLKKLGLFNDEYPYKEKPDPYKITQEDIISRQ